MLRNPPRDTKSKTREQMEILQDWIGFSAHSPNSPLSFSKRTLEWFVVVMIFTDVVTRPLVFFAPAEKSWPHKYPPKKDARPERRRPLASNSLRINFLHSYAN